MQEEMTHPQEGLQIEVDLPREKELWVAADPSKLLNCLAALVHSITSLAQPNSLKICVSREKSQIVLRLHGKKSAGDVQSDGIAEKAAEIRLFAAYCYIWTLGGEWEVNPSGLTITLPEVSLR
jgi:hypothetical protein